MTNINHFKIGLFFLGSLLVGIGALVWIGAAGIFQDSKIYATFFDSSISGLGTGSEVEYLGLSIGQVTDISLVPDRKLVTVLMELEADFEISESMAVQNKLAGITGKRYLELSEPPESVKRFTPKPDLDMKYPVIPSVQGQLANVEEALEKAYEKIKKLDMGELVQQWEKVAENANAVLSDKQIDRIIANLTTVSDRLETVTGAMGKPGAAKRWDQTFQDLAAAAQSAKTASQNLEQQLEKIQPGAVADIARQMDTTLTRIETATASTKQEVNETLMLLQQTLQQANTMITEFQMLARSLRREPGRILTRPEEKEPFEK